MTEFHGLFTGQNTDYISILKNFFSLDNAVMRRFNINIGAEYLHVPIPSKPYVGKIDDIPDIINLLHRRLGKLPTNSNVMINYEPNKHIDGGNPSSNQYNDGKVNLEWYANVVSMITTARDILPEANIGIYALMRYMHNNIDNVRSINDSLLHLYQYVRYPSISIYGRPHPHPSYFIYDRIAGHFDEIVRLGLEDNWSLQIWGVLNDKNNQTVTISDEQAGWYARCIKEFKIPKVIVYFEDDSESQVKAQIEGVYKIMQHMA